MNFILNNIEWYCSLFFKRWKNRYRSRIQKDRIVYVLISVYLFIFIQMQGGSKPYSKIIT